MTHHEGDAATSIGRDDVRDAAAHRKKRHNAPEGKPEDDKGTTADSLSEIEDHGGGLGQAGTAEPEPGIAESQGGGIEGAVGGGQSGQGGG